MREQFQVPLLAISINIVLVDTSTSSTFDEEWEYKKGWQSCLNLVSPSQWTKASKSNEGGEVALYSKEH